MGAKTIPSPMIEHNLTQFRLRTVPSASTLMGNRTRRAYRAGNQGETARRVRDCCRPLQPMGKGSRERRLELVVSIAL
eukprot:15479821-Alexandrium_andersonii.AAC.1